MSRATELDALLPQTQCQECGFPGCMPYAQALAAGLTSIDRCPPGGVTTLKALAEQLKLDPTPYLANKALHTKPPAQAIIREAECIGCTKCIQACPVDAIIGSAKQMHSILAHECTGCGLCLDPCPVDCIELVSLPKPQYNRDTARSRYANKQIRALRAQRPIAYHTANLADKTTKQDYIQAALARVRVKKNAPSP